jgi:tetratricopeptide (TPR) repeat protein
MTAAAVLVWSGSARAGVGMGEITESPEVRHARMKEQAERYYETGMRALAEGRTSRAVRFLLWVAKMRIDSPYPKKAFDELTQVVEKAEAELAVARDLVEGEDPEAGIKELARIRRVYMGLGVAKDAGHLMARLEEDPEFQQILRVQGFADDFQRAVNLEAEAEALREAPPEKSDPEVVTVEGADGEGQDVVSPRMMTPAERRAARIKKLAKAHAIYKRIVRHAGETALGKEAATALNRLAADEELAEQIREQRLREKARQWLGLASNYYRAGRSDLAEEYCRKILDEAPTSPQAEEARVMLESINR